MVEGVTQRHGLQTEVRAVLQITVRRIVRQIIRCRTVCDKLLQHVLTVGKHLRAGVVSTRAVVDLIAKDASEEQRGAEVLVVERVVPTQVQLRLCTASDGTILESRLVGNFTCALACLLVAYIIG